MRQDKSAYYTTMFDLYRLPSDFPGLAVTQGMNDLYQKVDFIEKELAQDIKADNFIPYIQLHEFEALLLSEPKKLGVYYLDREKEINTLIQTCAGFITPEHINDGNETAPSKRITSLIPEYANEKRVAGPIIAQAIGINKLREQCYHFNTWLTRLEQLRQGP